MDVVSVLSSASVQLLRVNSSYPYLVPQFLLLVPEDSSTRPGSGGQWGSCSWVPQDYIINGKRVLKQLSPTGHNKKKESQKLNLFVKEPY